jgi:hypothetical protein
VVRTKVSPVALAGLAVFGVVAWRLTGANLLAVLLAVAVAGLLMRAGMAMLGGFARPVDPPPPPGELRKVRIQFRCSICGTEVRMTAANDEMPEAPRHCQDDMDLVTPVEDL